MRIVAEKNIYDLSVHLLSRKKKRIASNFLEEEELSGIHGFTKLPAVNFHTSSGVCFIDHYMNCDNELDTGLKCYIYVWMYYL